MEPVKQHQNSIVEPCCSGAVLLVGGAAALTRFTRKADGSQVASGAALAGRTVRAARAGVRGDHSGHRYAGRHRRRRTGVHAPDARGVELARNRALKSPGVLEGDREAGLEPVRRRHSSSCPGRRADGRRRTFDEERVGAPGPGVPQVQIPRARRLLPVRNRRDAGAALRARARCLAFLSAADGDRPRFGGLNDAMDFDAIVVGSGISGGWVAKELCERGLKTLVIERGRNVKHRTDYLDFAAPWDVPHRGMVPEDEVAEHYAIQSTVLRVQLRDQAMVGARQRASVLDAGRPALLLDARLSPGRPLDHLGPPDLSHERLRFQRATARTATASTGRFGTPTFRRGTTASRRFAGISGRERRTRAIAGRAVPAADGAQLRRSRVQEAHRRANIPTRRVTVGRCAHLTEPTAEHIALGRGPCQLRSTCERGCGYGAYFSSLSATLPAAQKTGNLTVVTDAIVERLDYDHAKRRVSGVRVIDTNTRQRAVRTRRASCSCARRRSARRRSCSRRNRNIFRRASRTARAPWAATSWIT